MTVPVSSNYQAATGNVIYGGKTAPAPEEPDPIDPVDPSTWNSDAALPAGTFRDISLNTLVDVRPVGWPSSDVAGPFLNWVGGALATDFSTLGAYTIYGSGHLSSGAPLWGGVWCFDLDTLQWVGRNVPAAPLLEADTYNLYGESTVTETLGHTYPPHTYDGLAYQSAAQGGGTKGALLSFFYPGDITGKQNVVHQFDLSSTSAPPERVIDHIPMNGSSGNYPMNAVDASRGGVWVLTTNGVGPLKFVAFDDWSVTSYAGVEYGTYGDNSLVYLPAPYDCLVGMGRANADGTQFDVYVCPIVADVPQGFTKVTTSGAAPADSRSGGVWSILLDCIVSYEASGSTNVHRLTPPSGSLTSGTWVWTHETLTGVGGVVPSNPGINTNSGLPFVENGAWGRFIEVPAARCFIWCNGVNAPVQAWRLQGM